MDWECGVGRCKLFALGWIDNKVVLYIAQGTIFDILRQTILEKNIKKEYTYICVRVYN